MEWDYNPITGRHELHHAWQCHNMCNAHRRKPPRESGVEGLLVLLVIGVICWAIYEFVKWMGVIIGTPYSNWGSLDGLQKFAVIVLFHMKTSYLTIKQVAKETSGWTEFFLTFLVWLTMIVSTLASSIGASLGIVILVARFRWPGLISVLWKRKLLKAVTLVAGINFIAGIFFMIAVVIGLQKPKFNFLLIIPVLVTAAAGIWVIAREGAGSVFAIADLETKSFLDNIFAISFIISGILPAVLVIIGSMVGVLRW